MADTFRAPTPEVQYPGFVFPAELSVGELFALSRENPCGNWAMKDFFKGSREKVHCMLPIDHEYEYGLPHIDFDHSKAWRQGTITDVWYKDKSPAVPESTPSKAPKGTNKEKG